MADNQEKTLAEEAGLPPNWGPIDVPAIVPSNPPPAPSPNYQTASLPPSAQHDVSFVKAGQTSPDVPKIEIQPLTNTAVQGSQIQSGISKNPAVRANIAQTNANTIAIGDLGNAPGYVSGLSVAKAVAKDSNGHLIQIVEVSFTPPANGPNVGDFQNAYVFATGYQGGTNPVQVGTGFDSPLFCEMSITGEVITLTVQSNSTNGVFSEFADAPTITVTLDGVTTPPAAPSIASGLAGCNSGLTFAFNYEADPTHDVIDSYKIYRNTVNNSATATVIKAIVQPSQDTGTYIFTDVVPAGLVYWYWVSALNTTGLESTLTAAQSGAVQSGTIAYMGAYSGAVIYYPGASVTYSGQFYTCILQSTGNLPTNATYWQSTGSSSSDVFLGAWSNVTPYVAGNQVTYSGGYYIAIASTTGNQPDVSPTKWQIVGSINTYIFIGAYNGGTTYNVGNQVTYLGSYWICISNSTGNTPDINSSFWVNVGTSAIFEGAWNSGTTYPQNSQVEYANNIWVALQSNLNHAPPTPPATNAYWQLLGPATMDALANGTIYVKGTAMVASSAVVIPNNNFEASASLPVPGWTPANSATLSYLTSGQQSGTQSLIVTDGGANQSAAQSITQYACTPGDTFLIGGYAKSDGTGLPRILMLFYGASGFISDDGVFFSASTSWSYQQTTVTAPAGSTYFIIGLYNGAAVNASAAYFDNIYCFKLATLGTQVVDGPANFSATASTLSYRPLSNPLTATDAGSNVTISIAAFTMRTSSKGDISIGSGSITTLSYGTLYYLYYDDSTLAGGSVSFNATTTQGTALNGVGRFFVGSILTPVAGAPDTIGNNDGGTGAQYGTHIARGGTTTFATGAGQYSIGHLAPKATDTDWSTYATFGIATSTEDDPSSSFGISTFGSNFDSFYPRNVSFQFKGGITATLDSNCAATRSVTVKMQYSIDDGLTWTTVATNTATGAGATATLAAATYTVTPANGTMPAKIQCQGIVTIGGSGTIGNNLSATSAISLYEASYFADV